ncbi:MAG: ATP-binding protein [Alphaproteobacteria bacterium]|nr:ATP-binding protein [Alphaproteobacteria bacterium]
MSDSPFSYTEGLHIGTVDFVAPNEVKVLLDINAPDSVALNVGDVRSFPRTNGYVLIPVNDGHLVGQIEWITIERSAFPKRKGMQDFGLIDLPYPLRKMCLNPVGTLWQEGETDYIFRRGANAMPTVGAPALLPTNKQLVAIVQSGPKKHVNIGTSPLAEDAAVWIDPDRLFGRHLAVLGNTGSGKSCSVAGIIRWSLEAAQKKRKSDGVPHARFIVLDPNGEYSRAFSDLQDIASVKILETGQGESSLKVPLWFLNGEEWASFTYASAGVQRPLLKRALRSIRACAPPTLQSSEEEKKFSLQRYLSLLAPRIKARKESQDVVENPTPFGKALEGHKKNIADRNEELQIPQICTLLSRITNALEKSRGNPPYYNFFSENVLNPIIESLDESLTCLGGKIDLDGLDEDIPLPFKGSHLLDWLRLLAQEEGASHQHVSPLISRVETFLSNPRIASIVGGCNETEYLTEWLEKYLGAQGSSRGQVTVLNLSLVPTEIVHVVTAVISRMIFSALQRHRKLTGEILPTVLVAEEAHTFIRRYKDDSENQSAATVCCQVFERIAREGRKHGLGLVLSSQRPSELSPTVLSQCNTFLLHRISNDSDQKLVGNLLPDSLRGLLRELPLLPSQQAILLGWASELPLLVKMHNLPKEQRPLSDDPDYWKIWTEPTEPREVDWQRVADDWQARHDAENEGDSGTNADGMQGKGSQSDGPGDESNKENSFHTGASANPVGSADPDSS